MTLQFVGKKALCDAAGAQYHNDFQCNRVIFMTSQMTGADLEQFATVNITGTIIVSVSCSTTCYVHYL